MARITVFTPAYNRAHTLPRTYHSLCRQTSKDFLWLVVDDGSTDETGALVEKWQSQEREFEIRYIKKDNGGLHTAYNAAIAALDTELAMCIDSDDWLTDDAIEKIIRKWELEGDETLAGIEALDCYETGDIIGDPLPAQKTINLIDLYVGKYPIRNGDRKPVVRSDLYQSVAPMPTLNGEKNFNPHYMHLQISMNYDFLVMNEPVCIVEYQPDGMSRNIFKQYADSPNSFAQLRRLCMQFHDAPLAFKFRNAIHYVSSCLIARKYADLWNESASPACMIAAFPFGFLLSLYIRICAR